MSVLVAALSFFTGCAEPTSKDSGPAADTASDTAADTATDTATDTAALDLIGTPPDAALDAPEFDAQNRDGGARARADLVGQPTVMWFFPSADTPGCTIEG